MPKRKYKRTPLQRELDYQLENELHLKGYRNWEIALEIGKVRPYKISPQQVSYDLAKIKARWAERTTLKLDEHKQRELERLEVLEREYWEQFEDSKGVGRDGKPIAGNPEFLLGIQKVVELRAKLLGLEAPKQSHVSGDLNVQQSAKLLVLGKIEQMAARAASLYPSEAEDDNSLPLTLPEPKAPVPVTRKEE